MCSRNAGSCAPWYRATMARRGPSVWGGRCRVGMTLAAAAVACTGHPIEADDGPATSSAASTSVAAVDDTSGSAPSSDGGAAASDATGPVEASSSAGTTDGDDTTGGAVGGCGDGIPIAGELCWLAVMRVAIADVIDVQVGDIDGDDRPDLLVLPEREAPRAAEVLPLLRDAAGVWSPGAALAPGVALAEIAVADLDEDGFDDVIGADEAAALVTMPGSAAGLTSGLFQYSYAPHGLLVVGDFDDDDDMDIGMPWTSKPEIDYWTGNGDGALAYWEFSLHAGVLDGYVDAVVGDFTGDGLVDVLASSTTGYLDVHVAAPGQAPTVTVNAGGGMAAAIDAADLDGDGALDVVGLVPGSGTLALLRGLGDGTLDAAVPLVVDAAMLDVAAGDVDDDGNVDLVLVGDDLVQVWRNHGEADLQPTAPLLTAGGGRRIRIARLDDDGLPDLVIAGDAGVDIVMSAP